MARGTKAETLERLQDANKKLRGQVRQLRKRLKDTEQEMLILQDIWQAEIEEVKKQRRVRVKNKKSIACPKCGSTAKYEEKKIGVWKIKRCSSCEYFDREQEE